MKPNGTREIVVEYEQIKLIRKRANTVLAHCERCGGESDFICVADAAGLFEVAADDIISYGNGNGSHFSTTDGGDITLCLPSLLAAMRKRTTDGDGLRLIEPMDESRSLQKPARQ